MIHDAVVLGFNDNVRLRGAVRESTFKKPPRAWQSLTMRQVYLVLGGIVLAAGFLGLFFWRAEPTPDELPAVASPSEVMRGVVASPEVQSEGGPTVDALSLPALAQQKFDGRDLAVGRVLAETAQYTRYYITYTSGQLTISGIMNVPKGAGPWPVLILNHGYIDPAIYTNGRGLKREQDYLVREGYVVIHPDYRNHAESSRDAAAEERLRFGYVEDVINLVRAVKASSLPYLDTTRIGMLGHSMGGGVAQAIAVAAPDLVRAIVLFAPVSADQRDNFEKWTRSRPAVAEKIIAEYGSPEAAPEFWDGVSPLTYFDRVQVPILIHHGSADDSVPLAWSERTARELEAAGKDVTFNVYPGEPHEFATAWPTVMQRTTVFFDEHVKN